MVAAKQVATRILLGCSSGIILRSHVAPDSDRVWAVRRPRWGETWCREAGDLHVPGLCALLWKRPSHGTFTVWRKTAKKRMWPSGKQLKQDCAAA